jgi:hypothetical protein
MKKLNLLIIIGVMIVSSGCGQTARTFCNESADNFRWVAEKLDGHVDKAKERNHRRDVKYVSEYLRQQEME